MKKIALILLSLTITLTAGWWRTYGGDGRDAGYCVRQIEDSAYIVTGIKDYIPGSANLWLLKLDSNGDSIWTRSYGEELINKGNSLVQTSDSGYIIVGCKEWFGGDLWLIKTDKNGDTLWTKTFGNEQEETGYSVCQTRDSGYIITGFANGSNSRHDLWIIKTDKNGDTTWSRVYTKEGYDCTTGYCVKELENNTYIVSGQGIRFDIEIMGFTWLLKINEYGDTVWTRKFQFGMNSSGDFVEQTDDSGYIIVGHTGGYEDPGSEDYYAQIELIKTDSSGNKIWRRTYGDYYAWQVGKCIQQTEDGNYIVIGSKQQDVWLLKLDSEGDTLWTRTYGVDHKARGRFVQQTVDGGYILVGESSSYGEYSQIFLLKTDSLGFVSVEEQPQPETQPTFEVVTAVGKFVLLFSQGEKRSQLGIFDASGRLVDELLLDGLGTISWGDGFSPGVYFIREMGKSATTHKVVLVR